MNSDKNRCFQTFSDVFQHPPCLAPFINKGT